MRVGDSITFLDNLIISMKAGYRPIQNMFIDPHDNALCPLFHSRFSFQAWKLWNEKFNNLIEISTGYI